MKAVILAGGAGSRLSEETVSKPKPMIEIGGRPILWHLMKICSAHGINDFIICCGYKGYLIKEYFANYYLHQADVTIDLRSNALAIHACKAEPWKITLVDTGEKTMTGGRLKRVAPYLDDDSFCFTYGDGLADVNLTELIAQHRRSGVLATVTAVQPPARFGALVADGERVTGFQEKPAGESWINGGFFVLSPPALSYIAGDETVWEREPLERLTAEGHLGAYVHRGFFQPMDTLRDKQVLQALWDAEKAPWCRDWPTASTSSLPHPSVASVQL